MNPDHKTLPIDDNEVEQRPPDGDRNGVPEPPSTDLNGRLERELEGDLGQDLERANTTTSLEAPEADARSTSDQSAANEARDNEDDEPPPPPPSLPEEKPRPITAEVRYYNYESYMNRMVGDQGDFVIEALIVKPDWHEDVAAEDWRRTENWEDGFFKGSRTSMGLRLKLPHGTTTPQEDGRLQRVRVRSKSVIEALHELSDCGSLQGEKAFDFSRPFGLFEKHHEQMKERLAEMVLKQAAGQTGLEKMAEEEQKVNETTSAAQAQETTPKTEATPGAEDPAPAAQKAEEDSDDKSDVNPATEELISAEEQAQKDILEWQCFINFVEEKILPIRKKYQSPAKQGRLRVRHEEIPYLYQPGILVYLSQPSEAGQTLHRSAAQHVFRLVSCEPPDIPTALSSEAGGFSNSGRGDMKWSMYCLDYDGEKLKPIWRSVSFTYFNGERDVTSLECYPLVFHPNYSSILEEQRKAGQNFKSCIAGSIRHLYYSGWTFITGIRAEPMLDEKGEPIQYPEYIESEVVIDFKETLRNYPKWETETGNCSVSETSWSSEPYPEMNFRVWDEELQHSQGVRRFCTSDVRILVREDQLFKEAANQWLAKDKFLIDDAAAQEVEWDDEDYALLPKRLFGYVLRERRFARLDVKGIEANAQQSGVTLDHIQMKDSRRKMIRSAVSSHFRARQNFNLDVIQGKGKGLVILLHGAPGVGKTATAEAVAIENSKPLFPITCGDLGFSPVAVDKSLRDIFRYAHLWECILLLDEADVFLTQRDRNGGNLERNALVGVFLRVLEYYSGILFLTTNRVGALDEAFQSRVHLSLCYPHLSLDDTVAILQSNLNRLPRVEHAKDKTTIDSHIKVLDGPIKEFVESEYKKYSKATKKKRGPWNGRQIRNAVQIAAGLAFYDKEASSDNDGLPAILTADHFRSVAETTLEFEEYLKSAKVGDETTLARQRQDRDDDFYGEEVEEYPLFAGHSDAGGGLIVTPQRLPLRPSTSSPVGAGRKSGHGATGSSDTGRRGPSSMQPEVSSMSHEGHFDGAGARPSRVGRRHQYYVEEREFDDGQDDDMIPAQKKYPRDNGRTELGRAPFMNYAGEPTLGR